jgi:hypothetical protein
MIAPSAVPAGQWLRPRLAARSASCSTVRWPVPGIRTGVECGLMYLCMSRGVKGLLIPTDRRHTLLALSCLRR